MKVYQTPELELWVLCADEALAAVVQSEPTVEDTDENLSV